MFGGMTNNRCNPSGFRQVKKSDGSLVAENNVSILRRKYAKLIRFGNWLLIPIYILIVGLPLYYEWVTNIPVIGRLNTISGELTYKWTGGRTGAIPSIKSSGVDYYFTCRDGLIGNRHDCPNLYLQKIKNLTGREATAWWFEHDVYPFLKENKLIRLTVDGEDVFDSERERNRIERSRKNAPWYALIMFVFSVVVALYFEYLKRKIEHGQANN